MSKLKIYSWADKWIPCSIELLNIEENIGYIDIKHSGKISNRIKICFDITLSNNFISILEIAGNYSEIQLCSAINESCILFEEPAHLNKGKRKNKYLINRMEGKLSVYETGSGERISVSLKNNENISNNFHSLFPDSLDIGIVFSKNNIIRIYDWSIYNIISDQNVNVESLPIRMKILQTKKCGGDVVYGYTSNSSYKEVYCSKCGDIKVSLEEEGTKCGVELTYIDAEYDEFDGYKVTGWYQV